MTLVVLPKHNRLTPREYGLELYKMRHEVEHLFRASGVSFHAATSSTWYSPSSFTSALIIDTLFSVNPP